MTTIEAFKGKHAVPKNIQRFAAYVNDTPALMIEFFDKDYHVYGARAANSDIVIHAISAFHGTSKSPLKLKYRFIAATGEEISAEWGEISKTVEALAKHEKMRYMEFYTQTTVWWFDLFPAKNPRSGFATRFRMPSSDIGFVRFLTPVDLTDEDLGQIYKFIDELTFRRYPETGDHV